MEYKSTNIEDLSLELKERVVTFEYRKKDGSVRTAQGTLNEEYIPEKLPEVINFDVAPIRALMTAKHIWTLEDYAKENGLEYIGKPDENTYSFKPIKKEKKVNENVMTYYDVEKDAFRSFKKDNFLGIVK